MDNINNINFKKYTHMSFQLEKMEDINKLGHVSKEISDGVVSSQ